MDKCPKCGGPKEQALSQCDACIDAFCREHSKWPPRDCYEKPIKYVSKEAFQKLWSDYVVICRWGNDHLARKGIDNLWNYEENCWWAIHPEE